MEKENMSHLPEYTGKLVNAQLSIKTNAGSDLIASIKKAKHSIRIISPFIGLSQVETLLDKCREGIDNLKLITGYSIDDRNATQDGALKKIIFPVKETDGTVKYSCLFDTVVCRGYFLHEKLYLVDAAVAYIGSLNFTDSGIYSHSETCLKIEAEDAIKALNEYYDKVFDEIRGKWDIVELRQALYSDTKNTYGGKPE